MRPSPTMPAGDHVGQLALDVVLARGAVPREEQCDEAGDHQQRPPRSTGELVAHLRMGGTLRLASRLSQTRTCSSLGPWRSTTWSSPTASSSTAPACPGAGPTWPSRTGGSRPSASSTRARASGSSTPPAGSWRPGIVDPHTHYDPQLTFEPYGTSSCYHGVTTVVAGNCGFSVAPAQARRRAVAHPALRPRGGHGRLRPRGHPRRRLRELPGVPRVDAREDRHQRRLLHRPLRPAPLRDGRRRPGARGHAPRRSTRWPTSCARPWPPARPGSRAPTRPPTSTPPTARCRSRLSSLDELKALSEAAGRCRRRLARLPARLRRRRHHAGRRGAPHRDVAAVPDAGDHPGPRRPLEGRRPHRGLGQRQALRRRGHRPGRGRVLDGHVEAVQPHLQPGRRHEALRGRAAAQPPLHRGDHGGGAPRARSPTPPSGTRSATRSTNPNRDPDAGPTLPPPHWAVLHVNKVAKPENDKLVGRSLVDIAAERGVHPTDAFLDIAAVARTSPSSSCGRPRRPSGSRARRSPRTTRT